MTETAVTLARLRQCVTGTTATAILYPADCAAILEALRVARSAIVDARRLLIEEGYYLDDDPQPNGSCGNLLDVALRHPLLAALAEREAK